MPFRMSGFIGSGVPEALLPALEARFREAGGFIGISRSSREVVFAGAFAAGAAVPRMGTVRLLKRSRRLVRRSRRLRRPCDSHASPVRPARICAASGWPGSVARIEHSPAGFRPDRQVMSQPKPFLSKRKVSTVLKSPCRQKSNVLQM